MKQVNENGFWRIENNPISQVGVFPYLGKNISDKLEPNKIYFVYRPAEELFAPETLDSFNSTPLPLVDEHEMLGDGATPAENKGIHGVISNVRQDGKLLVGDISIYSETMKDEINRGKKDLSMGYYCEYDLEEGEYDGQHYDAVQRNLRGNHVALVDQGRCGHSVRVYDHFALDADFKEEDHPRKKDGKFAPKGQGEATGGKSEPKEEKIQISQNQNRKKTVERARNVGEKNRKTLNNWDFEDSYRDFINSENGSLTEQQMKAVYFYTGDGYEAINEFLRGERGAITRAVSNEIDELTTACNHQFRYDQILYRGTGLEEVKSMLNEQSRGKLKDGISTEELKKELVGKIYEAKSFVSTTTQDDLSQLNIVEHAPVELKIIAPAGTRGLDLTFDSANGGELGGEQEVLLQKDTKFEITNVSEHSGRLQIEMSVVVSDDYQAFQINKKEILEKYAGYDIPKLIQQVDESKFDSEELKKQFIEILAKAEVLKESRNDIPRDKISQEYEKLRNQISKFGELEQSIALSYERSLNDVLLGDLDVKRRAIREVNKILKIFNQNPTSIDSQIALSKFMRSRSPYVSDEALSKAKKHLLNKLNISQKDYQNLKQDIALEYLQ